MLQTDLVQMLESGGLSDTLRAQLRAQVLRKVTKSPNTKKPTPNTDLISSLFLDFLKKSGFDYTIAVFLPEAGLSSKAVSGTEARTQLRLETVSGAEELPVIAEVLAAYHRSLWKSDRLEVGVQTEGVSLEEELDRIESAHKSKGEKEPKTAQEHLLSLEIECRERAQLELAREIAYIRNTELSAVRVQEGRKYQEMINKLQSDYELKWRERLEEFKSKEKSILRLSESREKELEARITAHKFELEKDENSLKRKEAEIADCIGATLLQLKTQQETYSRLTSELESKTAEMDLLKSTFERKSAEELQRLEREFESSHYLQRQQVLAEREETDRLRKSTEIELFTKRDSDAKAVSYAKELENCRKKCEKMREEVEEYKEMGRELREELGIVSDRAKRSTDLLTLREMMIESLRSELRTQKDTITSLKDTITRLNFEARNTSESSHKSNQSSPRLETQENTEFQLQFSAWKVERAGCWRELDSLEAEIKRKSRDNESVPTQRYKDAFSDIIIPRKAEVPMQQFLRPNVLVVDELEGNTTYPVQRKTITHRSESKKTNQKPRPRRSEGKEIEGVPIDTGKGEFVPREEAKKTVSELLISDLFPKAPQTPQLKEEKTTVKPNSPSIIPVPASVESLSPPENAPYSKTGTDSIIEEIMVESESSSRGKGGFLLESESLEAPSLHPSDEEENYF